MNIGSPGALLGMGDQVTDRPHPQPRLPDYSFIGPNIVIDSRMRVTQAGIEVVTVTTGGNALTTQAGVEIVTTTAGGSLRATQAGIEVVIKTFVPGKQRTELGVAPFPARTFDYSFASGVPDALALTPIVFPSGEQFWELPPTRPHDYLDYAFTSTAWASYLPPPVFPVGQSFYELPQRNIAADREYSFAYKSTVPYFPPPPVGAPESFTVIWIA